MRAIEFLNFVINEPDCYHFGSIFKVTSSFTNMRLERRIRSGLWSLFGTGEKLRPGTSSTVTLICVVDGRRYRHYVHQYALSTAPHTVG